MVEVDRRCFLSCRQFVSGAAAALEARLICSPETPLFCPLPAQFIALLRVREHESEPYHHLLRSNAEECFWLTGCIRRNAAARVRPPLKSTLTNEALVPHNCEQVGVHVLRAGG